MKLNKLQRYTAYCLILAYFEDVTEPAGRKSFCIVAWDMFQINIATYDDDMIKDFRAYFPELINKMPKRTYDEAYWFHEYDLATRIKLIKKCIIETHP